jgi:hypothetical protein
MEGVNLASPWEMHRPIGNTRAMMVGQEPTTMVKTVVVVVLAARGSAQASYRIAPSSVPAAMALIILWAFMPTSMHLDSHITQVL